MDDRDLEATYDLVHQAAMAGIDKDFDDWREHPMFRTDLPEDVDNDKYLSCFQTVMYEGETHDSLALHFKELGNELYKSGRHNWLAAANWWSRGLEENPSDPKLRSILHSNRATVSLGLQQYQKAALDADWAIKWDPKNPRAYVRAAHAYQGMSNWDKALAAARAGLEIIPEEDKMHEQLEQVVKTCTEEEQAVGKRTTAFMEAVNACGPFFKKRGISVGKFQYSWMGNWELSLRFDEEKEETIWPLAITYNEVLQVDFVEGFGELTPIRTLMEMVLPGVNKDVKAAAWDTEERYKVDTVLVYVETNAVPWQWGRQTKAKPSRNVEVSPDCCLRDVFTRKEYVIPGYPVLFFAVRDSNFAKQLAIETVWQKE